MNYVKTLLLASLLLCTHQQTKPMPNKSAIKILSIGTILFGTMCYAGYTTTNKDDFSSIKNETGYVPLVFLTCLLISGYSVGRYAQYFSQSS